MVVASDAGRDTFENPQTTAEGDSVRTRRNKIIQQRGMSWYVPKNDDRGDGLS
jgi:hypothetical protein